MSLDLDVRAVLTAEVKNLTTAIEKMNTAIENSKLDLEATKLIKSVMEKHLELEPELSLEIPTLIQTGRVAENDDAVSS